MDSPRNILRTVKAAKNILIPLHLRPDGDSIGSALACFHLFKGLGKKSLVVSVDPFPDIFLFLPGSKRIKVGDPAHLDLAKFDLVFLVDNASPARFSKEGEIKFSPQTVLVNIDHHESNRNFGDLNYVIPNSASTAEILYDLIKAWKISLSPEIAGCLLTGIYTDTEGFLYSSTTAGSLEKAADLVRHGGNQKRIVERAFRSWSPNALRLWSEILARTKIRKAVAYSSLPFASLKGTRYSELSGICSFAAANLLLATKGVGVVAIFTEEQPRRIRVTLRSSPGANVSKVAEKFGGGGHEMSAAFDYRGPLKKIIPQALKMLKTI